MTYPPQDPTNNPYGPPQPPPQAPGQPAYQPPAYPQQPSYDQPGQQPAYQQPAYGQPQQPSYDQPGQQPAYQQPSYDQTGQQQPAYGQPQQPYQAPQQYGQPYQQYGQPQVPQRTNGLAVAAMILGILGGNIIAIILGAVALGQIKSKGEKGKGMAITGMVLGLVTIIGCAGIFALSKLAPPADRDNTGNIVDPGKVQVESLRVGDCVNDLKEGEVESIAAVPCTQAHSAEVYTEFSLTGTTYPGEKSVTDQADKGCADRFEQFIAPKFVEDESIGIYYLYPSVDTWKTGDRKILCLAEKTDGTLTGSMRK